AVALSPIYRTTRRRVGAVSWPPAGTTSSVMLCGGSVTASAEPATATSGRRAIVLAAVSCQARAAPPETKLAMLITAGVLPDDDLLTTMTVSAPSDDRNAANAATASGLGAVAATLVSPKAERLPS